MELRDGEVVYIGTTPHKAARPMKVVVDDKGCLWLCDADADESEDLRGEGCWPCSEMPFTRND